MSQLADEPVDTNPASVPGRLRAVMAVLVFQALANLFLGWVILDSLGQAAAEGVSGTGVGYLIGYLTLALAALLVLCVVYTVRPRAWVRPVIMAVQWFVILNGTVSLLGGSVTGLVAIGIGIAVLVLLSDARVRTWYQYGPFQQ